MNKEIKREGATFTVRGYGASGAMIGGTTMKEMEVTRPIPTRDQLLIEVLYSGVCHSDIHQVNNDWNNTRYPCVPGHEIIGRVVETAVSESDFEVGDIVGVGCMIDSCQTCASCQKEEEQFCLGPHGPTMTYNGYFNDPESDFNTFGGYATHVVADKKFVLRIPDSLDIQAAAPILCAGITTYSPLKHYGVKAGDKVGIVGIGGLGHMGVQLAKAMGAQVTAITTSEEKKEDVLALGADAILLSTDEQAMQEHALAFDFILITIPYAFDVNPYVELIAPRGSLVTVGLLGQYDKPLNNMTVAKYGRSVGGSIIGGVKETQEVLDFCAEHQVLPEVKLINIKDINSIMDKVVNEKARFRYVIDMSL